MHQSKRTLKKRLAYIANVPNRYITKVMLERFVPYDRPSNLRQHIGVLSTKRSSPATAQQREKLEDLHNVLIPLHQLITSETPAQAGEALLWLIRTLDLARHYDNYYGKGENPKRGKGRFFQFPCLPARQARRAGLPGVFVTSGHKTRGKRSQEDYCHDNRLSRERARKRLVILPS